MCYDQLRGSGVINVNNHVDEFILRIFYKYFFLKKEKIANILRETFFVIYLRNCFKRKYAVKNWGVTKKIGYTILEAIAFELTSKSKFRFYGRSPFTMHHFKRQQDIYI